MIIVQIALSCLLLVGVAAGRPQDSYLAPAASEAVALYSSPSEVVETYDEATSDLFDLPEEAVASYGGPEELLLPSQVVAASYGFPQDDVISAPSEAAPASYGLPREEVLTASSQAIGTAYGLPSDQVFSSPSESVPANYGLPSQSASTSYGLPKTEVLTTSSRGRTTTGNRNTKARSKLITLVAEPVAEAENDVFFSASSNEAAIAGYGQPLADNSLEAESQVREVSISSGRAASSFNSASSSSSLRREPEKILRSEFSGPNEGNWNYAYETENGIKQEARGELKTIGDAQVRTLVIIRAGHAPFFWCSDYDNAITQHCALELQ